MSNKLTPQEYQDFFSRLSKSQKKALYLSDMEEAQKLDNALTSITNKNSTLVQALIYGTEICTVEKEEPVSKQEKTIMPEKVVEQKKEISAKDLRLDSLDNFEIFFNSEFGIKELKNLGVEINPEEKIVDLSGIKNPQYIYLGKTRACASLAKLYKLIGEDILSDIKLKNSGNAIMGKSEIKKVFDVFFKMLGYEVITGKIKPRIKLESFDDYLKYFESEDGINELNIFGVKINSAKKTFDLSEVKRPQSYNLGPKSASVTLFKIRELLNDDNLKVENNSGVKQVFRISAAQEILKVFFERAGYKIPNIKTKKISSTEIPEEKTSSVQKKQEEVKKAVLSHTKPQETIKKFYVDGKSSMVLTSSEARDRIYFN